MVQPWVGWFVSGPETDCNSAGDGGGNAASSSWSNGGGTTDDDEEEEDDVTVEGITPDDGVSCDVELLEEDAEATGVEGGPHRPSLCECV